MFSIAFLYNTFIDTVAYILLMVLGWKMHRYTLANLKLNGVSDQERKSAELNRQLNQVLIIQVYHSFIIRKVSQKLYGSTKNFNLHVI